MAKGTCLAEGCESPAEKRGQCGRCYQIAWRSKAPCDFEGCDRPRAAKGLCIMHYKRQRNGAQMDAPPRVVPPLGQCSIEGCDQPDESRGWCPKHYMRWKRTGDPLGDRTVVRPATCTVDGCDRPHYGREVCSKHLHTLARHGTATPSRTCQRCGEEYAYRGKSIFCPPCFSLAYGQIRLERLTANNVGMTSQDHEETKAYRALILGDPCVFCGDASTAVDHIHPVVRGGSDRQLNLAPVCQPCNSRKRDRSLLEFLLVELVGHERTLRRRAAHHVAQTDSVNI